RTSAERGRPPPPSPPGTRGAGRGPRAGSRPRPPGRGRRPGAALGRSPAPDLSPPRRSRLGRRPGGGRDLVAGSLELPDEPRDALLRGAVELEDLRHHGLEGLIEGGELDPGGGAGLARGRLQGLARQLEVLAHEAEVGVLDLVERL